MKNKNIVYRDVEMRVKGVLVGFTPYLRLPDPEVDRAQGFLAQSLNISSNLGIGLKLPYFIPFGESRDLLLIPLCRLKLKQLSTGIVNNLAMVRL